MYRGKDRQTIPLFSELFPFGGQLDTKNRWLKIAVLIPWDTIESKYQRHFSDRGRPAKDCRLVLGILFLKHMTGCSDADIVNLVNENPHMQAFCGLEQFSTTPLLDSSSLSKIRKRLGKAYVAELERDTYQVLIERKIIKAKGMLADATVFPEHLRYPTDTGLLNEARQWKVKEIQCLSKPLGIKVRTYCRKAQKAFLDFSKKKRKSKQQVRRMTKSLLQYLRRNIGQLQSLVDHAVAQGHKVVETVRERLDVVRKVFAQQECTGVNQKRSRTGESVCTARGPVPSILVEKTMDVVEFGMQTMHLDDRGHRLFRLPQDETGYNFHEMSKIRFR